MDVGSDGAGLVERADTHEVHRLAAAVVVAPEGNAADRAAHDGLASTAEARRIDPLRSVGEQFDPVGFDQCVDGEG
jgi:hypothetical protein